MAKKKYSVTYLLKELSASHYYHNVTVEANTLGRALDLAWQEIKLRPAVKGKRVKRGEIKFEQILDNE